MSLVLNGTGRVQTLKKRTHKFQAYKNQLVVSRICSSNWSEFPQKSGVKMKNFSIHHLVKQRNCVPRNRLTGCSVSESQNDAWASNEEGRKLQGKPGGL